MKLLKDSDKHNIPIHLSICFLGDLSIRRPDMAAIDYHRDALYILDQLQLPHKVEWISVTSCSAAADCIKKMQVRGAPAIAQAGALALAVELKQHSHSFTTSEAVARWVRSQCEQLLLPSRPTAVNLANACDELKRTADSAASSAKCKLF